MFGAAADGIAPREQAQQAGGAVGLAVFVTVANAGTHGLTGEALRVATVDGLRTAVLLAAAGIAVTALAALGFSRARQVIPG
ncbi:MAG: hypothetical protein QOI78_751 [Actinomycetota bacterium]|nr:hypothetical protein [Actinomycetota bacterium]